MCGETLDNKPPSQFYSEGLASDTLVGVVAAISRDLLGIVPRLRYPALGNSSVFRSRTVLWVDDNGSVEQFDLKRF